MRESPPLAQLIIYARIAILAALAVSAVLVADHLRPGPAFCPFEEACEKAAESTLGSVAGVPTSVIGAVAFGALLLLLLPARGIARTLRVAAGCLCVTGGSALVLYQAFVLKSFCPLCVVVDASAIAGGAFIILNALGRSVYDWHDRESIGGKAAWALGGVLAFVVPFAIPQETPPAFEEAVPLADADLEPLETIAEPSDNEPTSDDPIVLMSPPTVDEPPLETPAPPPPPSIEEPAPVIEEPARVRVLPVAERTPVVAVEVMPAPEPTPEPTPKPQPKVLIVEYLNAYCPHCRKTHRRLEKVLAELKVPVKRRRIYTWSSDDYPLWARACIYAKTVGKEDQMFRALMETKSPKRGEVFGAARRIGLDTNALQRFVSRSEPPAALVRDRRLARGARLKGLPTFDIGKRRLMGQQNEQALRGAIRAAAGALPRE